jgi:starvation-inducible DNA-binding protein
MARATSKKASRKPAASSAKKARSSDSLADAPVTVPGLAPEEGHRVASALQLRLHALNDLQLTLKHAHWNVVGPHFIGVHTMLDPQIESVREMVDDLAERMATMGVAPVGLPGALVADRDWDDYPVGRADTTVHLAALDAVYSGVIEDHRAVIEEVGDVDPVTEDLLIGQVADLEQYQWFVRAHLQDAGGSVADPRK